MATWINLLDVIYPVGSCYFSISSISPASIIGGTWSAIGGRFLLGANSTYSAGSQDGETTVTLTVSQMPSHIHSGTRTITSTLSQNYEGRENLALSGRNIDTTYTFDNWTNSTRGATAYQYAALPCRLHLETDCLTFTSWMEVKNSGNMG